MTTAYAQIDRPMSHSNLVLIPPQGIIKNVPSLVKWYNQNDGYGFVKPEGYAGQAFLHAAVLDKAGLRSVQEGERVFCDLVDSPRGLQVIALRNHAGESPELINSREADDVQQDQVPVSFQDSIEVPGSILGTVKFYIPEKGFGFVKPDVGDTDIFIHVTALERNGVGFLEAGQRVSVTTTTTSRGVQVETIQLV